MRIIVNDEAHDIDARTLEAALARLDFAGMTIATAVNGAFVPASARAEIVLSEGDRIEVVAPMQGG